MNPKRILLIEDNPDDIKLTLRAFNKTHMLNEIVTLHDGAQAIEYLFGPDPGKRNDEQLPAIILLDLKLPKIDGLEVLRRLRADPLTRRLPVVILTSSKEERDIAAGYDLGANSYVRKPVDFEQFAEAVRQLGLYWLLLNQQPPKFNDPCMR